LGAWVQCQVGKLQKGEDGTLVERLLTVVQTRRLQGQSVLRYRYEALAAHRSGLHSPSLLAAN
jgi:hypothetical protein